jgi:hypothetical protein
MEGTVVDTELSSEMRSCIEDCEACHRTCLETAMGHCLQMGGRHVEPQHMRLMLNCAQICRTAADFMLSHSHLHAIVCQACAEVCEACANSCDAVGDMEACARECRDCADSCREMAQSGQLALA